MICYISNFEKITQVDFQMHDVGNLQQIHVYFLPCYTLLPLFPLQFEVFQLLHLGGRLGFCSLLL